MAYAVVVCIDQYLKQCMAGCDPFWRGNFPGLQPVRVQEELGVPQTLLNAVWSSCCMINLPGYKWN